MARNSFFQPNAYGQTPLHVAVNAEKTGSADAFLDPIEWLLERVDSGLLVGGWEVGGG